MERSPTKYSPESQQAMYARHLQKSDTSTSKNLNLSAVLFVDNLLLLAVYARNSQKVDTSTSKNLTQHS